ncbi:MAG: glycosyltransferase family 2 protein [Elusimicrobia bacterium]|nr:glycosyltransferase family 2 protein [Elusimicrobiota bacterium]
MPEPLVSIIIPAYNMADYTVLTIESVLAQTYKNIEIIVVDDGSKDNTLARLQPFADSHKIALIGKTNGGACSARNAGYRASRGELVAFLDCDDLYLPEKVTKCVQCLEKNPHYGMVFHPEVYIDVKGRPLHLPIWSPKPRAPAFLELVTGNFIGNSTPVIKRAVLDDVGLWDENIFIPADWDLWLRITEKYPIGYIGEALSKTRQVSCYSLRNVDLFEKETIYVLEKLKTKNLPPRILSLGRARRHFAAGSYYLRANNVNKACECMERAFQWDALGAKERAVYWIVKRMKINPSWFFDCLRISRFYFYRALCGLRRLCPVGLCQGLNA